MKLQREWSTGWKLRAEDPGEGIKDMGGVAVCTPLKQETKKGEFFAESFGAGWLKEGPPPKSGASEWRMSGLTWESVSE